MLRLCVISLICVKKLSLSQDEAPLSCHVISPGQGVYHNVIMSLPCSVLCSICNIYIISGIFPLLPRVTAGQVRSVPRCSI